MATLGLKKFTKNSSMEEHSGTTNGKSKKEMSDNLPNVDMQQTHPIIHPIESPSDRQSVQSY